MELVLIPVAFLAFAILSIEGADIVTPLRIGAWNAQRLGKTKMSKPAVVSIMVQVLRRYDVVAVLEVQDVSEETPKLLLSALNEGLTDTYNLSLSRRVGRRTYKEQYAIYYKPSRATLVSAQQYSDPVDAFEYDPYVLVFEDSNQLRFGTVSIHTKPDNAAQEIDALVDVYENLRLHLLGAGDVIILGDFNAGCNYVTNSEWANVRLRQDSRFSWLISDHVDTTVRGTACPYDRIVVSGANLTSAVYSGSAKAYYFEEELGLKDHALIDDVSDHYPVEVRLRGAVAPEVLAKVTSNVAIDVSFEATQEGLTSNTECGNAEVCIDTPDHVLMRWRVHNINDAKGLITVFASNNRLLVPSEAVSVLFYKLEEGALTDSTLYGADHTPSVYTIALLCLPPSCSLSISAPTLVN
ncbi:deoxyribonuclease-1-like [Penaeus chinensis]|uniref:deoxyribonuclease-1-like n=1 Tax=Penaeus chinensis TaxID=139456 RepID=UPI001FB5D519|nr:deoxyribonuclease-1-like [Penaeus chinensis]